MPRRLAILSLLIFLSTLPVIAQQFSGTIKGTVTDSTGAVVPDAEVSVVNAGTSETHTAKTNGQGEYVFPELPVGIYDVHIKSPKFSEAITKNVELHVASTSVVDSRLVIGEITNAVTVEANALQVQTDSASLGGVVNGAQVRELPMNGRNFVELTQLQPGVSAANNLNTVDKGVAGSIDFSVNGNSSDANLFLVDGSTNNDRGSNRTLLVYPSLEAIAEFKMQTNAYGPEFGQASGAVVNIVTRGGTNRFHGSAFYFGRNDVLNARSYFAARNTALQGASTLPNQGKDVLRRNDYGYSIGGPIKKDKLFFFWNQEWNVERAGQTRSSCVPTAAERAGNFTATGSTVCTPGDGKVFTVDPSASTFMQQFPLPTSATVVNGANWLQSLTAPVSWREENVRVDYNLTKSNAVMFRYTQDHWKNDSPLGQNSGFWGDDNLPGLESSWTSPAKSLTAKVTSTVTSSMVNDVTFNYSHNAINTLPSGTGGVTLDQGKPAELLTAIQQAIPTVFPKSLKAHQNGLPWVGFGGNTGAYFGGGTTWMMAPWSNKYDLYTVRDDLSKVYGSHTFKVGALLDWNIKDEQNGGADVFETPAIQNCVSTPGHICTNNTVENLMSSGQTFNITENSTAPVGQGRWQDYEFYFGDSWKVSHNLTVEYGARYSLMREPYAANDQVSRWDPRYYNPAAPASDACNGVVIVPGTSPCTNANKIFGTNFSAGTPGPNRSLMNNNNHLIAPRVGVSWDPFGDGKTAVRAGAGQFFQREHVNMFTNEAGNAPFAIATGVVRSLGGATLTLPLPAGGNAAPNIAKDPRPVLPNSWQWNFSVEHQLIKDTTLQVAYVGNRGIHLTSEFNINQVAPGNRLASAFGNTIRPYPNLGGGLLEFARSADSYYEGLQAQIRSQINKQLHLQIAYTWSHTIANTDVANGGTNNPSNWEFGDITNPGLDRGNSSINRPHLFVANVIYSTPALAGSKPFTKSIVGGWEVASIVNATSGGSVDVLAGAPIDDAPGGTLNGNSSLSGNGDNGGSNNNRPNRVPGADCMGGRKGDQLLNGAAYTLVGYVIGTYGNASRGSCEGPRNVDVDFALHKSWHMPFVQSEAARIQFRMEFFNLANHANFIGGGAGSQLSNDIGTGTHVLCGQAPFRACSATNRVITRWSNSPLLGSGGALVANPAPGTPANFGFSKAAHLPREIQYALKFVF